MTCGSGRPVAVDSAVARVRSCLAAARPRTGESTRARRSETTEPPVSRRLAAIRPASTSRPASSSTAVWVAPPTSRKHSRSGCHSACQAPAGRSSSASRLWFSTRA